MRTSYMFIAIKSYLKILTYVTVINWSFVSLHFIQPYLKLSSYAILGNRAFAGLFAI